jgi:hypothetical protein
LKMKKAHTPSHTRNFQNGFIFNPTDKNFSFNSSLTRVLNRVSCKFNRNQTQSWICVIHQLKSGSTLLKLHFNFSYSRLVRPHQLRFNLS